MNHGFHPAAESEHLEQVAYCEAQKPGLGQRYLSQVEATIARVCESPQLYRIDRGSDIRRAPVFEFPFQIIFREKKVSSRSWPFVIIAAGRTTGCRGSSKSHHLRSASSRDRRVSSRGALRLHGHRRAQSTA